MTEFLETLKHTLEAVSAVLWWPIVIVLLFVCGIYMTYVTGGIQFRRFAMAVKLMFMSSKKENTKGSSGDITPFQALMTALAATVGNGNIAGVATAIVAGGIGAPFWMWVTALIGMATKYAEGMLGLKYRVKAADGHYTGGAMYYIREGIGQKYPGIGKFLAGWFALALVFMATFGSGNMAQSNSIALALDSNFGVDIGYTGVAVFILVALILIGGIRRIGNISDKLVPAMIILYVGTALVIIIMNIHLLPDVFGSIFEAAFRFEAVGGGVAGHLIKDAMRYGVARGTLSSESGIGSCSMPAAAAKGNEEVAQGMVAMMGTFIDTILVCSMTTFVIVESGLHLSTNLDSVALTKTAFASGLGSSSGGTIVSICSAIFGFTTLIGWAYIGEQGFRYFFKNANVNIYRLIFCIFALFGALLQGENLDIVWLFGDVANGFMAIPNIIGLLFLGGVIRRTTKDYLDRYDSGKLENPFGT